MTEKVVIEKANYNSEDLFALFSPPNDANHYLIAQKTVRQNPSDIGEFDGFIFSDFKQKKAQFIHKDIFEVNPYVDFNPKHKLERRCITKDEYLSVADEFIKSCQGHAFEKLVLSRIKSTPRNVKNLMPLFLSLKQKYPLAFIYLINIPGQTCWIGATPELLLHKTNNLHATVALAGTRKVRSEQHSWGTKEIREHALVEEYFEERIDIWDPTFSKKGPYTKQAGSIEHICSAFQFECDAPLNHIIQEFHPSPAVCGLPKKEAFDKINSLEPHQRSYYTGYVGLLSDQTADIYVNLRCMEVSNEHFYLYIGGGITEESVAENEWIETEMKSMTLLSIIEKMYLYEDVIR